MPAVPVMLGDDGPYYFTPRKLVLVVRDIRELTGQLRAGRVDISEETLTRQDRWLQLGFGDEQWGRIAARRADENDPLKQDHINQLYEAMVRESVRLLREQPS